MSANIRCYSPGCSNPIIGQCPGYQGGCGRFYCPTHSNGRLCGECSENERFDAIVADYSAAADRINPVGCFAKSLAVILALLFIGLGVVFIFAGSLTSEAIKLEVYIGIPLAIVLLYVYITSSGAKRRFTEISRSRPGFEEFYQIWKEGKASEARARNAQWAVGLLGATVAGTAEGAKIAGKAVVKDITKQ